MFGNGINYHLISQGVVLQGKGAVFSICSVLLVLIAAPMIYYGRGD